MSRKHKQERDLQATTYHFMHLEFPIVCTIFFFFFFSILLKSQFQHLLAVLTSATHYLISLDLCFLAHKMRIKIPPSS